MKAIQAVQVQAENVWKMCVSCNQFSMKEDLLRQQKQNGKIRVLMEIGILFRHSRNWFVLKVTKLLCNLMMMMHKLSVPYRRI